MIKDAFRGPLLSRFSMKRPRHQIDQARSLEWLAAAHTASAAQLDSLDETARAAFGVHIRKLIDRVACDGARIGSRGHVIPDIGRKSFDENVIYDLARNPHGAGVERRMRVFAEIVSAYFEEEYAHETAPADLIHVTCTGYVSPSGAQRVVAKRGWGQLSRVTHAYHMGCYAAFPAIRMATGFLAAPALQSTSSAEKRVDIVHTELCSLHLDPGNHALEQLVVQSLFADGLVRYSLTDQPETSDRHGLRMLALNEAIAPDSTESMGWIVSDFGMAMNLSRDVPDRIGSALRSFVVDLYARASLDAASEIPRTTFAIHPGGPKIIDAVRDRLELTDSQVQTSRDVLFDHGNMSSATLPHVWMRMVNDPRIARGTTIASLAFGPGLTICGALFRKE